MAALNIYIFLLAGSLCGLVVFSEAKPAASLLDQNVFKTLEETKLKALKGVEKIGKVSEMRYRLDENIIEKVSAETGIFDFKQGNLHAELQTKGTLSGHFDVKINGNVENVSPVFLIADGKYKATIEDVDLKLEIGLPTSPESDKMILNACEANVAVLTLDLNANDASDKGILINLEKWLRQAMLPQFSHLLCLTMQKILDDGPDSLVVQALQRRTCSFLPPGACATP